MSTAAGQALFDRVRLLVDDLRRAGVATGLSSVVEACTALAAVDLASRAEVQTALRCTLLSRVEDEPVFVALFDARFPLTPSTAAGRGPTAPGHADRRASATDGADDADADLRDRIVAALATADDGALASLAHEAATRHGGLDRGRGSGDRYHLQRALRALGFGSLAPDALRLRRAGPRRDDLTERLDRTEITAALDRFLAALATATRAAREGDLDRGGDDASDASALVSLPVRIEDLDIASASVVELQLLRRAVRPLAQRLAARIARRQRRPQGALDMRRTIRRSLTSGGVPLDPTFRRRLPHRPDLWLLCDVSGSVAEFARFTIGVLTAIHDEVPRLRSFLFVDDVVEVTGLLASRTYDVDPFALVAGAGAPLGGRRSNWGAALARFSDDHAASLTPRSTVVLTGDARTHDHDPRADRLADLVCRTRGVWLLDPEPRHEWAEGDAAVLAYQRAGAHVSEVRTLAQLAAAVEHIVAPDR
ncbi:MAG: VWA domain-containing protein [Acidimicrobiales bacterium]